ncbi:MAG: response regulator [Nitrospiraceae bacterium]|nr:response regulator [Nitrospiraceae bacterium]
MLLKFILARGGYTVVHAADGQQAHTMIDEMPPPALVLLDIMLPYLNGLQLLAHIRQKAEWRQVPIIMLTADSNERDIQQALAAGANDYMVKPFNPRELTARLQRFLTVPS